MINWRFTIKFRKLFNQLDKIFDRMNPFHSIIYLIQNNRLRKLFQFFKLVYKYFSGDQNFKIFIAFI